jgi:hypothetical protein
MDAWQALALVALSVLVAGGASWLATRLSWRAPATTPDELARAHPKLVARIGALEAEVATERTARIAFIDEAEAILEAVDRKRKQVTSAAARLDQAAKDAPGGPNADPGDISTLPRADQLAIVKRRLRGL